MKEDIMRILEMVQKGELDSEKAAELIDALKEKDEENKNIIKMEDKNSKSKDDRMLKIRVISEKDKVNVNLPINFIKGAIGIIDKIPALNKEGINIDTEVIMEAIDNNMKGKIIEANSSNGDIVEVIIE